MKRRLIDAIDDGNTDAVYGFLERGIDVNYALWSPDIYAHMTPLMYASRDEDPTILTFLLAKGADINFKSQVGSALHFAVNNENINILRLLLLEGADPFIKDADGETPYDMAIRNNYDIRAEIFQHFMNIRRVQRVSIRKQTRNRVKTLKTLKNSRRLALMSSMESREGPMGTVRYDPSLMEHVSRYL